MALTPAERDFLHGEVSASVAASEGPGGRSTLVRVLGSHARADGEQLRLLVDREQATELLRCVAENGRLAAVYSEPLSHRTLQIKAADARVLRVEPDDLAHAARHLALFAGAIGAVGWPRAYAEALLHADPSRVAVLACTPQAVFRQTPGPRAGERSDGAPG